MIVAAKAMSKKNFSLYRQHGFSLVELLVGSTVGLIVVAGTIGLVVAILSSNNSTIKSLRLNQDLNALMAIMVSDIRRAGNNTEGLNTDFKYNSTKTSIDITTSPACISFIYEYDPDGSGTDAAVLKNYAFRINTSTKEIIGHRVDLDGGITDSDKLVCSSLTSGGEALNDSADVEITSFTLSDQSKCLDSDGNITSTCTAADDAVVRVRQIELTLTGQLKRDTAVSSTVQEIVRVRNNEPL